MKIAGVESLVVHAESRNWIFVKVASDKGLVGWGEATLEWKTRAVTGAVADLGALVVGRAIASAAAIEALHDEIVVRGYYPLDVVTASALSGIETALWDLLGQTEGVPIVALLGGAKRESVAAYSNLGNGDSAANTWTPDPAIVESEADAAVRAGFTSVKVKPIAPGWSGNPVAAVDLVKRLRARVGRGVGIALDLHGRCETRDAIALGHALGAEEIVFFEEPCRPGDVAGLVELRGTIPFPIATGERLTGDAAFDEIFRRRACDIVQPDVVHCGGLVEAKRIAARAAKVGMSVAPHNPLGPIATAAAVHLALAIENVHSLEVRLADAPWRDEIVDAPVRPTAGAFAKPTRPGLSVAIREDVARRFPFREVTPPCPVDDAGRVLRW
ncbi:MAG: mandelate racemase/muconate lactonizing enzyme family protein [Planctomycetes bacterium]|nr:mandelate racemase/muconate lactonizing enzyme family protein [Planctomycetota bacterium]